MLTTQQHLRALDELQQLRDDVRAAEQRLVDRLHMLFPVGARCAWRTGLGSRAEGEVIGLSPYSDRLLVHNTATGKKYWIDSYRLV